MTIGLDTIRDEQQAERLHWMLALPLIQRPRDYSIGGKRQDNRED